MAAGIERPQVNQLCATLPSLHGELAITEAPDTNGGFFDAEKEYAPVTISSPIPVQGGNWFRMLETHQVLSADNENPLEIDDGIFVQELPSFSEMYRVGTCVPDISDLVADPDIRATIFDKVEASYPKMPDGTKTHNPLLPLHHLRERELRAGVVRKAMIVSFLIGANHPPSDVQVSFEEIMTTENADYLSFSAEAQANQRFEKFARASRLIVKHLGYRAGLPQKSGHLHGSRMIESYNVAPNHLVGKMIAEEGVWPAVYRLREFGHGQRDDFEPGVFPPGMAYYSETPGVHAGFGLEPICRLSSPLRRAEDAWMNHILKQRYLGELPTAQDFADTTELTARLNTHRLNQSISSRGRVA